MLGLARRNAAPVKAAELPMTRELDGGSCELRICSRDAAGLPSTTDPGMRLRRTL
jgi:hypothetical protein